jgi:rod shape-determining protein MreD
MRYILYALLLYILLPFNLYVDLLAILIFFIVFNEDEKFVLVFSFFTGLLIDLYYPVVLGINTLIYVVLVQGLIQIKKYIIESPVVTVAVFVAFYFTKIGIIHLSFSSPLKIQPIIITIAIFFPLFMGFHKIIYNIWMKT